MAEQVALFVEVEPRPLGLEVPVSGLRDQYRYSGKLEH